MSETTRGANPDAGLGDVTGGVRADARALARPAFFRPRVSFVVALVLVAFVLRAGAAVVVDQVSHATGNNGYVERDDQSYDGTAWLQALAWRGAGPDVPPGSRYLLNVYTYTQAGLYFLIGHHLLAMKLLNCLFGALTAGLIYLIARQLFGPVAAGFSGVAAAFFPSTFFYSLVNFKDAMLILLVALLLWLATRLIATARWPLIPLMLVALGLIGGLRPFITAQLGLILPLAVMLQRRAHFPRKWGTAALLLIGCAGVLWVTDGASWFGVTPAQLNDRRFMMAAGGRSSYIPTPLPATSTPTATPVPTAVPTAVPATAVPSTAAPVVAVATATVPAATPRVTTAGATTSTTVTPPAVPTNLRVGRVTESSIEVLWDDNADNENGFQFLSLRGDVANYVDLAPDTTAYTVNGFPAGTSVIFYVQACNLAGCSVWSNQLTATTASPVPTAGPPPSTTEERLRKPMTSLQSLLNWLPTGLVYVLAAPFPWTAHRLVERVLVPEMLLWYGALACAALGLVVQRRHWRHYVHIVGYLAATLLTLGIVEGNLGTLVRQRGMLIPFTLILSGAGAAWLWASWRSRSVRRLAVRG